MDTVYESQEQNADDMVAEPRGDEPTPAEIQAMSEAKEAEAAAGNQEGQGEGTPDPEDDPNLTWVTNREYSVLGEKKMMPEDLAEFITSQEEEDYFRDLYTKAGGLDWVKEDAAKKEASLAELTEKHNAMDAEYGQVKQGMDRLAQLRESDFTAFARHWNVTDGQILARANEILELQDKGPEAQRQFESEFAARQQGYQNEQQAQQVAQQNNQMGQQLHDLKMQQALAAPDIAAFAAQFDERLGPGSFAAQVQDYGQLKFAQTQTYVEPSLAVVEVYKRNQALIPSNQAPATQPPGVQQNGSGEAHPNDPLEVTRIPNLGTGMPGAPVRTRVKTVADLRKLSASLQGDTY